MRKLFSASSRACGLVLLAALPPAALAVDSVSPAPGEAQLAVTQSGSLSINWRVQDSGLEPREVFSPQGEFLLGGAVVGTVSRRLSRDVPDSGSATLSFGETLRVPRSLIARAAQQGLPLGYRRAFESSYDDATAEAAVNLQPAGNSGAELSLSRIEIDFGAADPARYVSVDAGGALRPRARIRYGGSGLLQARWLIADPSSTGGEALFRTQLVVRQLLPGSDNEAELEGPVLPTAQPGIYELRFQVEDSDLADAPRLLYHVR